jgi:hypothetical protein
MLVTQAGSITKLKKEKEKTMASNKYIQIYFSVVPV